MSSATISAKPSSSTTTTRGVKSKPNKTVILKMAPSKLSHFPHEKPAPTPAPTRKPSKAKPAAPSAPTPIPPQDVTSLAEVKEEVKQESVVASAPVKEDKLSVSADENKKKVPNGTKAGVKRNLQAMLDPKPRAKPGPKKRLKMDGGSDDTVARPWTTPAPAAGHKLGPKANQGAINAGLRALDRTGKPCRKWEKKGFQVKSFTGVAWDLPSWRAPKKAKIETNGDTGPNGTPTSNSENQVNNQSSSNVGSENSHNAESFNATSSPAPGVMVAA